MILTCPQCQTRYQTVAAQFSPAGRKVRCAKCGTVWHQSAPDPEPEHIVAPISVPPMLAATATAPSAFAAATPSYATPPGSYAAPQPQARTEMRSPTAWVERLAIAGGWAGLVAIILVIGWTSLRFKQEIATLWPQSSSLYATLGVPVNTRGIEFSGVSYRREVEDGQVVLAVSGKLVNISTRELAVPSIVVTVTDSAQHELYHWAFNAQRSTLRPGQSLDFLTRLSSPPPGARHLQLHFAASHE
jgi:predicted Zn finger-like uncharacterized protein